MEGDESHVLGWVGRTEDGRNKWLPYRRGAAGRTEDGPQQGGPLPPPHALLLFLHLIDDLLLFRASTFGSRLLAGKCLNKPS